MGNLPNMRAQRAKKANRCSTLSTCYPDKNVPFCSLLSIHSEGRLPFGVIFMFVTQFKICMHGFHKGGNCWGFFILGITPLKRKFTLKKNTDNLPVLSYSPTSPILCHYFLLVPHQGSGYLFHVLAASPPMMCPVHVHMFYNALRPSGINQLNGKPFFSLWTRD